METKSTKPKSGILRAIKLTTKIIAVLCTLFVFAAIVSVIFEKNDKKIKTAEMSESAGEREDIVANTDKITAEPVIDNQTSQDITMPPAQMELIRIVNEARAAYSNASNAMLEGKVRVNRKQALCKMANLGRATNWLGTITELESSSEGKGVLAIEIEGENILIKTWSTDFSDIGHRSMINPNSELFAAVSNMQEGDKVMFSGSFYKSQEDCFEELSLTQNGSVMEPEFLFRFKDVKLVE